MRGFLEDNDPIGLSTRGIINDFYDAQDAQGPYHHVTDLDFHTWDIVENPASDGTQLSFDNESTNDISNLLFDNFVQKDIDEEEITMDDNVNKNVDETTSNQEEKDNQTDALQQVLEQVQKISTKVNELERNSVTDAKELQRQFELADQKKYDMDCSNEIGIINNKLPRLLAEARISAELAEECEEEPFSIRLRPARRKWAVTLSGSVKWRIVKWRGLLTFTAQDLGQSVAVPEPD